MTKMGPIGRYSVLILIAMVLYFGAGAGLDAMGYPESNGRTIALGAGIGIAVGGIGAALGLVGGKDDED